MMRGNLGCMASASMNRTLSLTVTDRERLSPQLIRMPRFQCYREPPTGIICGDSLTIAPRLPKKFVDLLILDPPYNLRKSFKGKTFKKLSVKKYTSWLNRVIKKLKPLLAENASIYICGDWLTSVSIYEVASTHFKIQNRITWEREKGRGAKMNWKNSSEDIWFCTVSNDYTFNVDAVKLRRKVKAPYRQQNGQPKDWQDSETGKFRDTYPSNIWTDITVPFWSMRENTEHPTQKSEKLVAKLILASSNPGDFVLDPFLGSGTSIAVAAKLQRRYLGLDISQDYCLIAARRLEMAMEDPKIQGIRDDVFWERNSFPFGS